MKKSTFFSFAAKDCTHLGNVPHKNAFLQLCATTQLTIKIHQNHLSLVWCILQF